MARAKGGIDGLVEEFRRRVEELLEQARAEGRESALAGIRSALDGGAVKRRPGRPRKVAEEAPVPTTRLGKKRRNPWAGLTPEQKLERVNAIRKGRGLALKEKL
jgi:hypothetical protein